MALKYHMCQIIAHFLMLLTIITNVFDNLLCRLMHGSLYGLMVRKAEVVLLRRSLERTSKRRLKWMKHAAILHFSLSGSEWSVVKARARIFTKDQLVFPLQVQQAPLNHKSISVAFWTFLLRISI